MEKSSLIDIVQQFKRLGERQMEEAVDYLFKYPIEVLFDLMSRNITYLTPTEVTKLLQLVLQKRNTSYKAFGNDFLNSLLTIYDLSNEQLHTIFDMTHNVNIKNHKNWKTENIVEAFRQFKFDENDQMLIEADIRKLDRYWQNHSTYLPLEENHSNTNIVLNWIKRNPRIPLIAPSVKYDRGTNGIYFSHGAFRYDAMRRTGHNKIKISIPNDQEKLFQEMLT